MVSLQQSLDSAAINVRVRQKMGRQRIRRQVSRRKPIGPQILSQRMTFRQIGTDAGVAAANVTPNLPRARQVKNQINSKKPTD